MMDMTTKTQDISLEHPVCSKYFDDHNNSETKHDNNIWTKILRNEMSTELPVQTKMSVLPRSILMKNVNSDIHIEVYECSVCKKTFKKHYYFVNHFKTHQGEKPYPCRVCDKFFIQLCDLKKHTRIHTGEKPYQCSICGKLFTENGAANRHARIHTGERPHQCSTCGKTFIECSHLARHIKIHTRKMPFDCPVRFGEFAEKSDSRPQLLASTLYEPRPAGLTINRGQDHLSRIGVTLNDLCTKVILESATFNKRMTIQIENLDDLRP